MYLVYGIRTLLVDAHPCIAHLSKERIMHLFCYKPENRAGVNDDQNILLPSLRQTNAEWPTSFLQGNETSRYVGQEGGRR